MVPEFSLKCFTIFSPCSFPSFNVEKKLVRYIKSANKDSSDAFTCKANNLFIDIVKSK